MGPEGQEQRSETQTLEDKHKGQRVEGGKKLRGTRKQSRAKPRARPGGDPTRARVRLGWGRLGLQGHQARC